MVDIKSTFFILFVLFWQAAVVTAFPSGAGSCPEGIPAVAGLHLFASTIITGSLSDGGFLVMLDGNPLTADTAQFLSADEEHTLELKHLDGETFRGFLFRLGSGDSGLDTSQALSTTSSLAKPATNVCGTVAGSITHNSRVDKTSMEVSVKTGDIGLGLPLDVTVVVVNSGGVSEYYHSQFILDSDIVLTLPPIALPTMAPVATPFVTFPPLPTMPPTPTPTPEPTPRRVRVRNPNFERDNNAWKVIAGTAIRECGAGNEQAGDCNMAFTGSSERQRIKQRLRDIEGGMEGDVFELKFWVMAENLMFKNNFKALLKLSGGGGTSITACKSAKRGTFEYEEMTCSFTADRDIDKAILLFEYSATVGALYLDRVSMTQA